MKSIKNHFVCFVDAIRNWKSDQWGVRGGPLLYHAGTYNCVIVIGRCRESIPWLYRSHQQDIWHYSPFFFFFFPLTQEEVVSYFGLFCCFSFRFAPLSYLIIYKTIFFPFNLMRRFVDSAIGRMRKNPEALGMLHQVAVLYTHVSISVKLSCSILL